MFTHPGSLRHGWLQLEHAAVDLVGQDVDHAVRPLAHVAHALADKGYDGDKFRENLLMRGILPIIPPRSNRKALVHPDYRRYKDRNRVERMFGKLKQQRRIATRYDKTVLSFESFLNRKRGSEALGGWS
jgi:transposase